MRILGLVLAAAGLLWGAPAWAQAPNAKVVATCGAASLPLGQGILQMDQTGDTCTAAVAATPALTSTNLSTAIAVTDTFQSIQIATAGRKNCTVQNNSGGSDSQWVFFGAIGSATKAKSVVLAAGQSVSCATPSGVLTDQISITGTATDTFFAAVQ